MPLNRKGMEIAINTIVAIIIGSMLLFAGLALFFTILDSTRTGWQEVDDAMRERMMGLIETSGDLVYVYPAERSGGDGKDVIFYVGIKNSEQASQYYWVTIAGSNPVEFPDGSIAFVDEAYGINSQETTVLAVLVKTKGLAKGQHGILVKIYKGTATQPNYDEQYSKTKAVYVNI